MRFSELTIVIFSNGGGHNRDTAAFLKLDFYKNVPHAAKDFKRADFSAWDLNTAMKEDLARPKAIMRPVVFTGRA